MRILSARRPDIVVSCGGGGSDGDGRDGGGGGGGGGGDGVVSLSVSELSRHSHLTPQHVTI